MKVGSKHELVGKEIQRERVLRWEEAQAFYLENKIWRTWNMLRSRKEELKCSITFTYLFFKSGREFHMEYYKNKS